MQGFAQGGRALVGIGVAVMAAVVEAGVLGGTKILTLMQLTKVGGAGVQVKAVEGLLVW
jgi:hypothetical protein